VDVIRPALEEINKKWRIYKCVSKARMYDQQLYHHTEKNPFLKTQEELRKAKNPLNHLSDIFMETLLEDPSYAGIFIDLNLDVKQAIGDYRKYFQFPETQFNFNLTKLLPADLSILMAASARKAIQENHSTTLKEVKWHTKEEIRSVDIHIKPFLHHSDFAQQFLFIVLKETKRQDIPAEAIKATRINDERVEELERELKDTRENLQAVIEEMEATNEELQSSNEEMISTNEELQSANEELQSLNEELHTVSVEHQLKIKELLELNDDLNNYFRNAETGQILVDKNLLIRKFTPSVTRMVNLIPGDVNRSLMDITTKFPGADFIADITKVIRLEVPVEKEISISTRTYLMRISPYERSDKKIDGVVISFTDITRVKQLDSMLDAVFKAVPNAILTAKPVINDNKEIIDFEFVSANAAAEKSMGLSRNEIIGKRLKSVVQDPTSMFKMFKQVVESGKTLSHDYFNQRLNQWGNMVLVKFMNGVLAVSTDITEKKKAADLVEKNYAELRKSLKLGKK
jgi:two-component system CheB/CheR fusion protein